MWKHSRDCLTDRRISPDRSEKNSISPADTRAAFCFSAADVAVVASSSLTDINESCVLERVRIFCLSVYSLSSECRLRGACNASGSFSDSCGVKSALSEALITQGQPSVNKRMDSGSMWEFPTIIGCHSKFETCLLSGTLETRFYSLSLWVPWLSFIEYGH